MASGFIVLSVLYVLDSSLEEVILGVYSHLDVQAGVVIDVMGRVKGTLSIRTAAAAFSARTAISGVNRVSHCLRKRETVALETPARRATSAMLARSAGFWTTGS